MCMESKKEMIATSLRMRANYIETGDVCLSRNDALRANEGIDRERQRMNSFSWDENRIVKIKELDINQQKLVILLRELADEIQFS